MLVYVLEAQMPYDASTVLGVYASREAAEAACRDFAAAERASQYPTEYDYYVVEVGLGAAPRERFDEGALVEVE